MLKNKNIINSIGLKELIGSAVCNKSYNSILGSVSDIVIEPQENRIFAFLIMTHSLIPLSRIILFHNITDISRGHIFVKSENSIDSLSSYKFPKNSVLYKQEAKGKPLFSVNESVNQQTLGIIKNARFDLETGVIEEFIISKNKFNMPWTKNEKIAVNKFRVDDNTIIIE